MFSAAHAAGAMPGAMRIRRAAPPPAIDADMRVHESTGLSMAANGGWTHIISFSGVWDRTQVMSLVCGAFLRAASAFPRSATFDLMLLGGTDAFSFDKLHAAHARFPALHNVSVALSGDPDTSGINRMLFGDHLFPQFPSTINGLREFPSTINGLREVLPQLERYTSIISLNLTRQHLFEFPAELCALTGLKKLNLYWNKINTLPDAINELKELTLMNIGDNPLATPQSSTVEAWIEALHQDPCCTLTLPDPDYPLDGNW